jgi:hypothetical protein
MSAADPVWEAPIQSVTESDTISTYAQRREAFEAQRLAVHKRWLLIANIRLAGFALLAVVVWWALRGPHAGKWALAAAILVAVIVLVAYHASLRRTRDRLAGMVAANDLAIARLELDWEALPELPTHDVPRSHAYAWDLDVVGDASLLRRISTPTLLNCWTTLRQWLLAPAGSEEIIRRQVAVRELGSDLNLRQLVEVAGRQAEGDTPDPEPFLAWSGEQSWLIDRSWIWMVAIVSPACLVVLGAMGLLGMLSWPLWLIPISVNVVLFQAVGKRTSEEVARATPLHEVMAGYAEVFRLIGDAQPEAPLLVDAARTLGSGADGATSRMKLFSRISSFVVPRGSIIWSPLQMSLLWDVHVLHALERWRTRSGGQTRAWFDAAGEWEAVAALSVLAHDHPGWTFPTVDPAAPAVRATALAHPLIHFGEAVAYDVEVGPRGTFLFVTGSNMSGKSTLLRAVGLNAVLAMAGAPVAATRFELPQVDVWTCMRVEDSLARGVSFFMAELQRLKAVVDAAADATDRPVLYLLDEILQGTNTAERQIASRRVLGQLAERNAIGGVSSHDLTLIEGSGLEQKAVPVHFAETFTRGPDGPSMTFDYDLRPGLATSTNALALMELLGFDVESGSAETTRR